MLFITLFSLCFEPWEACLPSEVLLEIIEILEKMIHNEMSLLEISEDGQ